MPLRLSNSLHFFDGKEGVFVKGARSFPLKADKIFAKLSDLCLAGMRLGLDNLGMRSGLPGAPIWRTGHKLRQSGASS